MQVPFFSFEAMAAELRAESLQAFERVYDAQWYVMGQELAAFEAAFAQRCGTTHAVGVGSGMDALVLALRALDVGAGDQVVVPANSFVATALAVAAVGAAPVFIEPDAYYLMAPKALEAALTPRTRAAIPVHLYGQPCRMDELVALAEAKGISLVEDNAQAHGASWLEKPTGSWGNLNAHSFYPIKPLGALGDGGALTTDDADLAERVRRLRNYGSEGKYRYLEKGLNSRLDEVQAALLSLRLAKLADWNQARRKLAGHYTEALSGVGDLALPGEQVGAHHVYHLYVIRTERRDQLQAYLSEKGIETLIHYPVPIHLQAAFAELGHKPGAFPLAERYADTCLSLPIYPGLGERQAYVIETIRAFFGD